MEMILIGLEATLKLNEACMSITDIFKTHTNTEFTNKWACNIKLSLSLSL